MKNLNCDIQKLNFCCGVSVLGDFGSIDNFSMTREQIVDKVKGTGLAIATFNREEEETGCF